ncbi:Fibronectin type III domain-containing protein [Micrococcales bacterium KH10]|nr:Fibronectin type III domain-containing protein [Micrococcales bacterium KH10]
MNKIKAFRINAFILGAALAGTAVIAPSTHANDFTASTYIDSSCGSAMYAGQVTLVQGSYTGLLYDAMSGNGTAPANWRDHYGVVEQVRWTETTVGPGDQVTMNAKTITSKQRAQIGYIMNRWGSAGSSPTDTSHAANYAIRQLVDAPRYACNGPTTTDAAAQMIAETTALTGQETGVADVYPVFSEYNPHDHSFTLTDVDVRDKGSAFSYASATTGGGLGIRMQVTGGSFTAQEPFLTQSNLAVVGNEMNSARTIYATRPGTITLALHTEIPSPLLHLLTAPHMATQIKPTKEPTLVDKTVTLQVPKDTLSVTKTIGATALTLDVTGYRPWLTGSNMLRAIATPPPGSGLPPVERMWPASTTGQVTLTGLSPNTPYMLSVADVDGYATSHSSQFTTGPVAPTNLHATAGATTISVSWQPAPGATNYEVTVGDITRTVTGTTTQITGLKPATTYPVTVQALNLPARGGSATAEARTTLPTPGKVTVARTTSTSTTISWPKVTGATRYRIVLDDHRGVWEPTAPTATLTGLTQGRSYTGILTALAAGETPSSARFTFTTAPSTVTGVKLARATPTSLSLSWRSGSAGTRYTLRVTGPKGKTVTVAQASATVTALKANKSYKVSIQATNTSGTSPWSPALTVRTTKKARPKITAKRGAKRTRITIKRAPKARALVQVRQGGQWRTVKKVRTKKTTRITTKVARSSQIRVVVRATATTKKISKVLR